MLVFLLNPNMLFLSTAPMTEPVFAASVAALLFATLWFPGHTIYLGSAAGGRRVQRHFSHAL